MQCLLNVISNCSNKEDQKERKLCQAISEQSEPSAGAHFKVAQSDKGGWAQSGMKTWHIPL